MSWYISDTTAVWEGNFVGGDTQRANEHDLRTAAWSAWFITFLTTGKNHGNHEPFMKTKWVGWAMCQAYMSTLKNGFVPPHSSHLSRGTAVLYAREVQAALWRAIRGDMHSLWPHFDGWPRNFTTVVNFNIAIAGSHAWRLRAAWRHFKCSAAHAG